MFLNFGGFCALNIFLNFTFRVAGGGSIAKFKCGFVDFIEFEKIIGFFSHFAREQNEQAGGEGVESTGVANFDFVTEFGFELAADFGDYAETRNTGGFINENNLIFH